MAKLPKEITDEIYQSGYEKGRADEGVVLLDKMSRRFHSRILFRELTRAELMNIFDDIIVEMKAEVSK